MKRLLLIAFLASFAVAVQAEDATVVAEDAAPQATPAEETVEITGDSEQAVVYEKDCVRHTGTRIRRPDKDGCNGQPGVSYSRSDIDATGAMTAAEALDRLDPRITR